MATKEIRRARVILKECRTYTHPASGKKFIKDVPQIVRGEEVQEYINNGFFKVTELESKTVKVKKKKNTQDDESEETASKPKKKLKKKISTKKKKTSTKNKKKKK